MEKTTCSGPSACRGDGDGGDEGGSTVCFDTGGGGVFAVPVLLVLVLVPVLLVLVLVLVLVLLLVPVLLLVQLLLVPLVLRGTNKPSNMWKWTK